MVLKPATAFSVHLWHSVCKLRESTLLQNTRSPHAQDWVGLAGFSIKKIFPQSFYQQALWKGGDLLGADSSRYPLFL
jgi:hypothetical protein